METRIVDNSDIKYADTVLHDAVFRLDAIAFDVDTGVFALKAWVREREAGENVRRWRAYTLTFHNVLECQIDQREDVSHCELASIKYAESAGRLELVTHYAVDVKLRIQKLDGTLAQTDETREWAKKSGFPWTCTWDNL